MAGCDPQRGEEKNSRQETRGEKHNTIHCQGDTPTQLHTSTLPEVTQLAGMKNPAIKASEWREQPLAMAKNKEQPVTAGDGMMGTVGEQRAIICPKDETCSDGG